MENQARVTTQEDSEQQLHGCPSPTRNRWHSFSVLEHFNCFNAVSETRNNAKNSADLEVEEEDSSQGRKRGGWKTMPYIIGNESCEKLAVVGLHSNMIVYLTTKYNMQKVAATNVLNIWSGTTSLSTLPGAFLADSYLGKFRTIVIGCISYVVGMSLLTLTALVPRLRPSACTALQKKLRKCERASEQQWVLLVLVFLFMCIGSAGIKPCSMAFGADQFQREGSNRKKRVQSFFNWYYFSSCVALIMALTVIIYIQTNVNWSLGFGICVVLMLVSTVFFLVGGPIFHHDVPEGSPFTGFAQVIVAAIRKRNLSLNSDPAQLYHCQTKTKPTVTDRYRFLNKAAIIVGGDIKSNGSVSSRWRLSPLHQIEALKSIIATLPIFSCGIANSITKSQQHTFSVLQALTMNRHLASTSFQIPAGSFSVFSLLVLIFWLPFYDRVVVRFFRRRGCAITVFQRMGIGLAISSLSMFVAGLVEVKRRNTARAHGLADDPSAEVPISAMWLLPQFCIGGLAEAFHTVGHLEFFYEQFPATMRSTAIALSSCTAAIGHYLSTVIVTVVHNTTGRDGHPDWLNDNLNRGRLEYFYWLLAGIEALNLIYFYICTRWYKYEEHTVVDEAALESMELKQMQP